MDMVLIGIGVLAAVGVSAGGYLWYHNRAPKEEPVYYYRCEQCKRKMRYYARQANHRGMCRICKKPFVFPPVAAAR